MRRAMTTIGQVVKLEHEDGLGNDDRDWVNVTVKLWGVGSITVRLRPHEARPYALGRKVDVSFAPKKARS
jgi:hypothetical protein